METKSMVQLTMMVQTVEITKVVMKMVKGVEQKMMKW